MRSIRYKKIVFVLLLLIFVVGMTVNVYNNRFYIVHESKWFKNFQSDSESLVIGAMAKNRIEGLDLRETSLGSVKSDQKNESATLVNF